MSTVAWDGKTLAADRQATFNGTPRACSKMRRLGNGDVVASTGSYGQAAMMIDWYESGANVKEYPAFQATEDWSRLIVLKPDGKIVEYEKLPLPILFDAGKMAWGSGADYALGAMAMGADAAKAVEVAILFDIHTGMGIETATMDSCTQAP